MDSLFLDGSTFRDPHVSFVSLFHSIALGLDCLPLVPVRTGLVILWIVNLWWLLRLSRSNSVVWTDHVHDFVGLGTCLDSFRFLGLNPTFQLDSGSPAGFSHFVIFGPCACSLVIATRSSGLPAFLNSLGAIPQIPRRSRPKHHRPKVPDRAGGLGACFDSEQGKQGSKQDQVPAEDERTGSFRRPRALLRAVLVWRFLFPV